MNTYTILKNNYISGTPLFVVPLELSSNAIYDIFSKVDTLKANSLIEAYYKVKNI
jgi:hypothetical protein